ncbi:CPBP family intramembrane glutamic endopeptidase [Halomontanus rarus]|uniref:CPBP family intramembrane glutamic endopeptidase n=1 Tax=Halomontanus rarus TaxID=3034020 RepID=UPI0023E82FA0|nr:CPBP family intramembrane glutamic endopeptidase [Halovivax sp. TS33]
MTQWATFVGLSGVVCVLLLALSHATKTTLTEPTAVSDGHSGPNSNSNASADTEAASSSNPDTDSTETSGDRVPSASSSSAYPRSADLEPSTRPVTGRRDEVGSRSMGSGPSKTDSTADPSLERSGNGDPDPTPADPRADLDLDPGDEDPLMESMSAGALLANVALSQGLFAAVLIAAAFYTEIPAAALGIEFTGAYLFSGLAVGTAIGLGLYVANEFGSMVAKRLEIDHNEDLREMLAPDSAGGWLILLLVVLPMIAVFEEFLFRAALIGAVSVGFGVSPWLLAVVSSVAFALGHGMQGTAGILVTGLLGFVLASAFVLTGSFLAVVVAHYLINALEFVVHEGFGLEWSGGGDGGETTES